MGDPLRILLLEDDPVDAELAERALRKAGLVFTSHRAKDRAGFLAALTEFAPNLVLADYHLPQFDGLEALELVRERTPFLPFIFVTGAVGEEGAVELLRAGADDYVLKDRLARLTPAIQRALDSRHQQAQLRLTECALRESEARFRALVETTADWIWEVDAEGRYDYVSPISVNLLGYTPEEMSGRSPMDFMAPDEGERVGREFAEIFADRRSFSMLENICLHKDGHEVVLETSGTPIFGSDGRLHGYRGIDRDVTERKRNEAALLLQTRRSTALLELPRAAQRMSETELMQLGLELAEELTASRISFLHFVNEDQESIELVTWSRRTLQDYCRATYDQHYPVSQAGVWADALRRRKPVTVNDYPALLDKAGLPEGHASLQRLVSVPVIDGDLVRMMVGVGNKVGTYDATDVETLQLIANEIWRIVHQRRAEQALRNSEAHLRTLIDTIPDLIWLKDTAGVYLSCNHMFERFFGATEAEIRGRTDHDFISSELADFFREHDRIAMAADRPVINEESVTFADDGHSALLETIKTPMRDPSGRLIGVLGIARDITNIRQAQHALRESEERFHALFENMLSGVWILAPVEDGCDFVIRDANLAVSRIEGLNLDAVLGRRLTEAFPGVVGLGLVGVLGRVWRTGVPEHLPPTVYRDGAHQGWRECFVYRLPQGELVTVYEDVTQRKRLELALEESRERLALALDASDLGTWDWQIPTGAIQVNARWMGMLGYDPNELAATDFATWQGLCHPDDLVVARGALERHFAGETPIYEAETRLRHKDGHWVWVLDRGKVVEWDAEGRPLRMAGTHLDVSARKVSEESLRKLSLVVEQSPASIVITDLEGRIEYVNPAFTQISGYSLEEARGQNPRILNSGYTPREVYTNLWETLERGDVWRGEFRNRRKDGSDYVELAIISPVRQTDGQITHYLAIKEDISDLKRAEEELERYRLHLEELVEVRTRELRLAEEHRRLILESSADGLYGVDLQGCATFVNPAACAMLGYRPEQLLGRSTHELIHHSHADGSPYPRADCPLHNTLSEGCVLRQDDDVFWRADGRSFPVTYASHPIYRDGVIIGAVISFFDISAQKQAEATRELALAEAERLARLKSEFLANMSHEIRTPLNAVLGFAQVGERESDGRKAQRLFGHILSSGRLLLGIVNDILDFSKIEAGKLVIAEDEIDLRDLIERCADLLRSRAVDKGLYLRLETAEDLPATFRGDELRLAQVLGNLLSNAIKFTARGGVVLRAARDGDWLALGVLDTGIGISEEQVTHLFRPFEQADGSITRRFGGTGLGLAISRRLVELMGGEIRVESQPDVGTRFELRIPLLDPRGRIEPQRAESRVVARQGHRQRLHGLMILVAEDNPENRLVLEELLNDEGCWLIQVEHGLAAVERVRLDGPTAFDLVLMDIQMPVMDGLEATRRIRELAPGLPVIGLTAHALHSERNQCLAAGMVDHVAKPVDLELLVTAILGQVACKTDGGANRLPGPTRARTSGDVQETVPGEVAADSWVDWQTLEARYAHNPEFLPRLLGAILESNADQSHALREAAKCRDQARLAFIAHRLKGTAGTIVARRLHRLAVETERCVHQRPDESVAVALGLADALDGLLREIRASRWATRCRVPLSSSVSTQTGYDAALTDAVERLRFLLSIDDTTANDVFEQEGSLLYSAFGDEARQLGSQIHAFDYSAALETLSRLALSPPS